MTIVSFPACVPVRNLGGTTVGIAVARPVTPCRDTNNGNSSVVVYVFSFDGATGKSRVFAYRARVSGMSAVLQINHPQPAAVASFGRVVGRCKERQQPQPSPAARLLVMSSG